MLTKIKTLDYLNLRPFENAIDFLMFPRKTFQDVWFLIKFHNFYLFSVK